MTGPRLIIIPSVPVWSVGDGLVFDRKFHDGMIQYVARWPGPVRCLAWSSPDPLPGFGAVHARPEALPFEVELLEPGAGIRVEQLAAARVVMAAADDHRQLGVAALCRRAGIRCAYVIEYIPETRHQINRIEARNPLVRWRRELFLRRRERARRQAFGMCHGLQANGLPAHEAYKSHGNCLLYFDTRMSRRASIDPAALAHRLASLSQQRPLRLGFSGRLVAMKGADHLVEVAARLRARGVTSEWTVYGTGELEQPMREQVRRAGLDASFRLAGAVDFETGLVPAIQSSCDLYVMLHRQSDPSCTYLETLACGIPIVGYGNRALAGLLRLADVGEQVSMDDIDAVVDALARLDADRPALARMSRAAGAFARDHAFEYTFQRRVEHLLQTAGVR
jgi:glycosyltransferase involved in cell wall biosynthesis